MTPSKSWTLITGATGGMGTAIVERCMRDGHLVMATDRSAERLQSLARKHPGLRTVDAALESANLVDKIETSLVADDDSDSPRAISGLVNLAGISQGDSIDRITDADWDQSLAVNATAPMRLMRGLLHRLERSQTASVINVASPVALRGSRKVSYSASKAALLGLTLATARNLAPLGIRVNALLPGATITGMTSDWDAKKREMIAKESLFGRLCSPEDIAGAVAFLLGPDSEFITGTTLDVTGGALLGAH